MSFEFDTYIVLDVPPPMSDRVMEVRRRHKDEFRSALPVEITLTGSSGLGVLERSESRAEVFSTIQGIAEGTLPIIAEFDSVLRFEGTDIFVLTLMDETPFRHLHRQIAESGIQFMPNPFPYKPHCTLRSRSPVSEEDFVNLMSLRIAGEFNLHTLSVYMMAGLPMDRLFSTELGADNDAG